jgi:hypothetical protein
MPAKIRAPYRPFEYLEAGADYREFRFAREIERVPSNAFPLDPRAGGRRRRAPDRSGGAAILIR